ncbi:helix-turn-helix domain-containing protein [Geomonas oryzae]|uniref:helix-turn-helix domain-containing protein n=1 Tax=Geomonas oryzae TaxID=2364273 RepID=UPI00100A6DA7|nr:helix-turn-helix transcriptional regulator [Geomonas oryzae]
MLERTKKPPTDNKAEARFIGSQDKISMLRHYAKEIGVLEASEHLTVEEAFPGYAENPKGMALKGARHREGLTQRQLAELTGIPQRHISELESGKRQMGKEWARRVSKALNVSDYRVFL